MVNWKALKLVSGSERWPPTNFLSCSPTICHVTPGSMLTTYVHVADAPVWRSIREVLRGLGVFWPRIRPGMKYSIGSLQSEWSVEGGHA